MKHLRIISLLLLFAAAAVGCKKSSQKEVGEAAKAVANDVEAASENAVKATAKGADEAGKSLKAGTEDSTKELKEAGEDVFRATKVGPGAGTNAADVIADDDDDTETPSKEK